MNEWSVLLLLISILWLKGEKYLHKKFDESAINFMLNYKMTSTSYRFFTCFYIRLNRINNRKCLICMWVGRSVGLMRTLMAKSLESCFQAHAI